ncbi:MAG: M23 family metallopeptidase [Bacteroidales bacterium]|nr:M23 family metallopeptidase [Bacteroidales bacterium]
MAKKDKTKLNKLTDKYRLVIYNDNTFEEVWFMRISRLNLLATAGIGSLLGIGIIFSLIAYTPVREFIPGYPDGSLRQMIIYNSQKTDSLERELMLRDKYLHNINLLVSGKPPQDFADYKDTNVQQKDINFERSIHDSLLRMQIEQEEQFNLSLFDVKKAKQAFPGIHFFTPVNGIVTNSFDHGDQHFGTDIVASPNEVVKATLDGTVVLATWTVETGYNIQIQHGNNLVSIYKHNAELLKEVGEHVVAGEPIAIIGNSGELTTGPHLHFEIWHNGLPLNPENYMVF